jgi:low temperature requirement protein LtrA
VWQAALAWLWFSFRRQDLQDHAEFLAVAGRYVAGMAAGAVVVLLSAALPAGPRLVVWACCAVAWVLGMVLAGRSDAALYRALPRTESLVERIGLCTIIVHGECSASWTACRSTTATSRRSRPG